MIEGRVYYSIKETSEQTGLPLPTLRYWESKFSQLNPRKDGHGNRYYTAQDIALIKKIRYIRDELKITRIEAIRNELDRDTRQVDSRAEAAEILRRVHDELVELKKLL